MGSKLIFLVVLCVVCVNCDDFFRRAYKMANIRAKRAKYYSSPPMRFYRKPPNTYPIKGPFSYTPPPNYKEHEDTYPGIFRPKVSKPHTNDGLGEEDLRNIVKYLSKQDVDKIIQMAGDKYNMFPPVKHSSPFNKIPISEVSDNSFYKPGRDLETEHKFLNGPHESNNGHVNFDMEYTDHSKPPGNYNGVKTFSAPDNLSFKDSVQNNYHNNPTDQFNHVQNAPIENSRPPLNYNSFRTLGELEHFSSKDSVSNYYHDPRNQFDYAHNTPTDNKIPPDNYNSVKHFGEAEKFLFKDSEATDHHDTRNQFNYEHNVPTHNNRPPDNFNNLKTFGEPDNFSFKDSAAANGYHDAHNQFNYEHNAPPDLNGSPIDNSFKPISEPEDYSFKSPSENIFNDASHKVNYVQKPPIDTNRPPIDHNSFKPIFTEPDNASFQSQSVNVYKENAEKFNYAQSGQLQQAYQNPPPFRSSPQDLTDIPLHTEESKKNDQISVLDTHIKQELEGEASQKTTVTFTDSDTLKEEELPKPLNLRKDEDYEAASSNNSPVTVKSSSYKVEGFGDLPLMNYHSKLDSVSSYHVPHYSVSMR